MARRPRANDELAGVGDVRVIDDAGRMLGVMSAGDALGLARVRGLDLVEVREDSHLPVCKILDLAKFKMPERTPRVDVERLIVCGRRLAEILRCPCPSDVDMQRTILDVVARRDLAICVELGLITRAEGRDLLLADLETFVRDHAREAPPYETWHDEDLLRSVEQALFVRLC